MGNCIYCGKRAGFFNDKHKTCETNYHSGISTIVTNITSAITKTDDLQKLENDILAIAGQYYIKSQELALLYTRGFNQAVQSVLDQGFLTAKEEDNFEKFKTWFKLDRNLADKNDSLKKAAVLRGVAEGNVSECNIKIPGYFPFKLSESEILIWVFPIVHFYEQHTGIYWNHEEDTGCGNLKSGTFKGTPVDVEEMKKICQGAMTLSNKQVYFSSPFRNFTIPYPKIKAIDPYEDAIGILVANMSATPQIYKGMDGWFIYNLIHNLKSKK